MSQIKTDALRLSSTWSQGDKTKQWQTPGQRVKKHLEEGVVTELQEVAGPFVTSQREEKVLAQTPQIVCEDSDIQVIVILRRLSWVNCLFVFLFRRVSPLIQEAYTALKI